MNKFHSFSVAVSLTLMAMTTVFGAHSAYASELFEPQNSHLTQSTLAPGSRFFIAVDDETAVTANERYVSTPADGPALFATTDRQAIAQWLAWAERERSPSPKSPTPPEALEALEARSQRVIYHANVHTDRAPLRVTYSIGPFYAN